MQLGNRAEIYAMDPERERLAMINTPRGRRKGQRDKKPRNVTPALIDSAMRARRLVTSEGRSRARMSMLPERRSEIARQAALARWSRA
jgi:hypothetical protein